MKNFISVLTSSFIISVAGHAQHTAVSENSVFYNLPVPQELKASVAKDGKDQILEERKIIRQQVTYRVRIGYNPSSEYEALFRLEITSDNSDINKKLENLNFRPTDTNVISACYSGEKQATPDWIALADCVVNYVQMLL